MALHKALHKNWVESRITYYCSVYMWTDSQIVLKWITNPDLHLVRFVKRRVDKILGAALANAWNYVYTSLNPADVATREHTCKNPESVQLWLKGPDFLLQEQVNPKVGVGTSNVSIAKISVEQTLDKSEQSLDKLIASSHNLYALKKHFAYLYAFVAFVLAKTKKVEFVLPVWNASYLNQAFNKAIKYIQSQCFGPVMTSLSQGTPDNFKAIVHKMKKHATNPIQTRRVNELHTLINLKPCLGPNKLLRVEDRLENADFLTDTKHPIILPGRHPLTRLVVLLTHAIAGHAGPAYTLMETLQQFWIIHGISSVKHYLADCASCTLKSGKLWLIYRFVVQ